MLDYYVSPSSSRQTRRLILDAVRNEIASKGLADLRLERVAARCGVSVRTVYRHFENKHELFETSCLELINQICLVLRPTSLDKMGPDDALLYHCLLLVDLFLDDNHRILLRSIKDGNPRAAAIDDLYERQVVRPINQPFLDYLTHHSATPLNPEFAKAVAERLWELLSRMVASSPTAMTETARKVLLEKVRRIARDYARLLRE